MVQVPLFSKPARRESREVSKDTLRRRVQVAILIATCGAFATYRPTAGTAAVALNSEQVASALEKAFPGAMSGWSAFAKVREALKPLGVKSRNTIYGQSVCSDEINNQEGQISSIMTNHFGKVFPMGGIGGAPFVGKTGFGAFSGHVPDGGNVVVLFGPHIGFSPTGEPAKFSRVGQKKISTACGALVAAYNQLTSGASMGDDPQDMEQSWLRKKLAPYSAKITNSSQPMVTLARAAYKEIEKEMLGIVNTNFGSGKLVLLGGIQINMPYPIPGYFLPLHFSVRSAQADVQDLMPTFK